MSLSVKRWLIAGACCLYVSLYITLAVGRAYRENQRPVAVRIDSGLTCRDKERFREMGACLDRIDAELDLLTIDSPWKSESRRAVK